jgi:hypothetical protein
MGLKQYCQHSSFGILLVVKGPLRSPSLVINFILFLFLINLMLNHRNVFNAVNFASFGQITNPTRDHTTAIMKDNDCLVIPGTKCSAVLITMGLINCYNIIEPIYNQRDRVKMLQLFPLAYKYERLLGWFRSLFGRHQLYGYISPDVALTFSTHKEAAGSQGKSKLYFTS